jgi:hypothetical protein
METTSRQPQGTTVALPAELSFADVRAIVAQMQAEQPEHRARIGRAINVLLTSEIVPTAELGRLLVQSCEDGKTYYTATTWNCTCPDRQRHDTPCKHSYALTVLSVMSAQAAYERAQAGYVLTQKGAAAVGVLA